MTTDSRPLVPTAHHPLGPSQWPMIFECADFEAEPDLDDPEDGDSDEEDASAKGRGRVKHQAVAALLVGDLPQRHRALDGLSEREVAEVQFVAEKAHAILQENGYSAADLRVEQRVTMMKPESFEPLYFGTGDGEAGPLDFDWKFGLERNYFPQLAGYALPKMEARNESRRFGFVIYGRLRTVRRYILDRKTVETVAYGLLARRLSPHRKPTPCQYCGWCAKRATCSAFVAEPVALVQRRDDWSLKLPSPHVSQLHDPAWLGAARFVWKRYLEPWGAAIDFASTAMASGGMVPAGYKKRPEKGRTSITDAHKAFQALKETVGEEVLWLAMDTTITKLTEAYADSAGISKAKAEAVIRTILGDARALSVGDATFKLIAETNAEDLIRAALARSIPLAAELPRSGVAFSRSSDQDNASKTPDGAGK